jgi:hypothetical protein
MTYSIVDFFLDHGSSVSIHSNVPKDMLCCDKDVAREDKWDWFTNLSDLQARQTWITAFRHASP